MQVRFTAVRRGVPIVPASIRASTCRIPQLQSALVVGPAGEEVHCDNLGRVKIRFPGMRAQDHEHAHGAGASGSPLDSAWVRVASNWAGNGPGSAQQCGTLGLPRVGTEVLVAFLGGDPDKPIVLAQLFNGQALPPAAQRRRRAARQPLFVRPAQPRDRAGGAAASCASTTRAARSAPSSRATMRHPNSISAG